MTGTGFRGAGGGAGGHRGSVGEPVLPGSPFSQAQIMHLMKTEFARARRYGFPVTCMLIEVDRLTSLVDLHGAALREAVRRELARLVRDKTRGADHLGLAKEERYLIILPHTRAEDGVGVAQRIRESFSELEMAVGGNRLALSLSVGVAGCEDKETLFFDTLLSQAEVVLDSSVQAGGNRVGLFGHGKQATDTDEELLTGANPEADGGERKEP